MHARAQRRAQMSTLTSTSPGTLPARRIGPVRAVRHGRTLAWPVVGDWFRYCASTAVVFAYGSILGFRIHTNVPAALAGFGVVMVFAFALCWVWALLAMYVKSPQSVQGFGFIVMFPLTFGS